MKDAGVAGQAAHSFLDARAPGIVDEHEGRAGLESGLHAVGDLVGVDLASRAAGHREVLAGQVDQASVHPSTAGDDAIGGQFLVGHAEVLGLVAGEEAEFLEGFAVEQEGHALAGGEFTGAVLLVRYVPRRRPFQAGLFCVRGR